MLLAPVDLLQELGLDLLTVVETTKAVAQLLQAMPEARITVVFRPIEEEDMDEEGFRSRFTDTEWELYEAGKCCWQTAYGLPWMEWCGQPSMPDQQFGYCREHDRELREQGGSDVG